MDEELEKTQRDSAQRRIQELKQRLPGRSLRAILIYLADKYLTSVHRSYSVAVSVVIL